MINKTIARSADNAQGPAAGAAGSQFTLRWGKDTGFARLVDRSCYDIGTGPLKDLGAELTERILCSYRTGAVSESRSRFLQDLTADSLAFLAEQRGMHLQAVKQESLYNHAVASLIERIFDLLQAYAYEFNHTMGWNDLHVTCTRPGFVTEVLRYSKFREPIETVTHFRARLSTRHISLVIRGRKNTIELMAIPVEKVIGLSRVEDAYEPLSRLECAVDDNSLRWTIDGDELTEERLEQFCMSVFSELIQATRAQVEWMQSA